MYVLLRISKMRGSLVSICALYDHAPPTVGVELLWRMSDIKKRRASFVGRY